MPDPKTLAPGQKAKVKRFLKERRGPGERGEEEPPHSPLWWKMVENQEYTKVTPNGKHIAPRGGGIPTVSGSKKPRRTP